MLEEALLHLHDLGEGLDIAHLEVQGGVLVQMTLGGVLLRPEHGGHLVHPLKDAHHGLLIELGGLSQEGLFAKVVQAKDVGPALGSGVDDFGGVDLGKPLALEVVPEGPADGGLDAEHRPLFGSSQHHRPQAQLGVQVQVQLLLGQRHRQGRGGTGQDGEGGVGQLFSAGGTGFDAPHTGGGDRTFLGGPVQGVLLGAHALDQTGAGAQGDEVDAAHVPQGMDCAVDGDGLVIPALHRFVDLFCQEYHTVHNLSCLKKIKKVPKSIKTTSGRKNSAVPPVVAPSPLMEPLGTLNASNTDEPTSQTGLDTPAQKCCAIPSCRTGLSVGDPDSLSALTGGGLCRSLYGRSICAFAWKSNCEF